MKRRLALTFVVTAIVAGICITSLPRLQTPAVAQYPMIPTQFVIPPITATSVTVNTASSDTVIATCTGTGLTHILNLEVDNANGGAALTEFKVQLQDHPSGEWYDYLSGTDWTSTTNSNMIFASTDVHTLAANTKGHIQVRFNAAFALRIAARCATSTTITAYGTFKP